MYFYEKTIINSLYKYQATLDIEFRIYMGSGVSQTPKKEQKVKGAWTLLFHAISGVARKF